MKKVGQICRIIAIIAFLPLAIFYLVGFPLALIATIAEGQMPKSGALTELGFSIFFIGTVYVLFKKKWIIFPILSGLLYLIAAGYLNHFGFAANHLRNAALMVLLGTTILVSFLTERSR